MNIVISLRVVAIILAMLIVSGCASTADDPPEGIPLTKDEIEFLKKLDNPDNFSVKEDVPSLFFRLNQLHKQWELAARSRESKKRIQLSNSFKGMLTRIVYVNFDKIIDQLENGSQPNRVIAAYALGFSRIPENEKYPQIHQKAMPALLSALESGDDNIIENALHSLKLLENPSTPLDNILPLMTQHHNPEVRSNAALCISAVVSPDQADLVTPYILPALKDDDPKVRIHTINIALNLKNPSATAPLMELMSDPNNNIRANAARALGVLGDISSCGVLITNLSHPSLFVRKHCLESLIKLTGENFGEDKRTWDEWWIEYRRTTGK